VSFRIKGIAPGSRPPAAVEILPEGILAAATPAPGAPPLYAAEPLPTGSVLPGLAESNLPKPAAITAAVRAALSAVNPRTRAVSVILPDASVRVFVLDFDTFPAKLDDAIAVLRFRLRKSVPFDAEHAGISFQVLVEGSARNETPWKLLAAAIPGPVLAEYESAVRAAGFEPGAVLPASLAAIAGLDGEEAFLVAHLAAGTLTTTIVAGNDILLHRTLDLPADSDADFAAEVQRAIAVAAAFYEDKLRAPAQQLVYAGSMPAPHFAAILNDPEFGLPDLKLVPLDTTTLGAVSPLGGRSIAAVTGALAETR
jgi:type IV pilus assembly protein PilM